MGKKAENDHFFEAKRSEKRSINRWKRKKKKKKYRYIVTGFERSVKHSGSSHDGRKRVKEEE